MRSAQEKAHVVQRGDRPAGLISTKTLLARKKRIQPAG